jgi:hypothetical protein
MALVNSVDAFTTNGISQRYFIDSKQSAVSLMAHQGESEMHFGRIATSALLLGSLLMSSVPAAYADEYGRETEAPTMFTGETTMVSPFILSITQL